MPFSKRFHKKDTTIAKKTCSSVSETLQTAECDQELHKLVLSSCHEQRGLRAYLDQTQKSLPCHLLLGRRMGDIER